MAACFQTRRQRLAAASPAELLPFCRCTPQLSSPLEGVHFTCMWSGSSGLLASVNATKPSDGNCIQAACWHAVALAQTTSQPLHAGLRLPVCACIKRPAANQDLHAHIYTRSPQNPAADTAVTCGAAGGHEGGGQAGAAGVPAEGLRVGLGGRSTAALRQRQARLLPTRCFLIQSMCACATHTGATLWEPASARTLKLGVFHHSQPPSLSD